MPLVHIEHTVGRGSLRHWIFLLHFFPACMGRTVSNSKCGHQKPKESFWTGGPKRSRQSGAVLSSGAEADTLRSSRIPQRADTRRATPDGTFFSFLVFYYLQIPEIVLTWKTQTNKNKILSRFKSSFWARWRFPFGLALSVLTLLLGSFSSYSALLSPVPQLLPLTQPSGASPSDDVLGEETHVHSSLSLALKIVFRKFQKFTGVEEEFIAEGFCREQIDYKNVL